jgi:signal transduction histidine kinase
MSRLHRLYYVLALFNVITLGAMGIPRPAQARLFEKFYRADNAISKEADGTGLGLHLVRLVVEHAGGQIWCDSEEGEGSRLTFTLPVVQQEGVRA